MPCLGKNNGVCKSSANCVGSALTGLCGTNVSQCSNDSIKVNVVSACAFVTLVCGDSEVVTWCTLVRPVVN